MDPETAEPAHDPDTAVPTSVTTGRMARRTVLARAGALGTGALVASLAPHGVALAAPADDEGGGVPSSPTSGDLALLEQAMGVEASLSELYAATVEAGPPEELAAVAEVVGQNHLAYAQAIAGMAGLSLKGATPALYDPNVGAFTSSPDGFLQAARDLERQAVATHTELLDRYESADAITATASILVMEARYATVWSDFLGTTDLDDVFADDASPLPLSTTGGA